MENFVLAKAIGFVLAGMLIALFSDRRAVFWGGTLVVGAFVGYANPVWGIMTVVELALGWFVGRWLLNVSRDGRGRLRDFWERVNEDKDSLRRRRQKRLAELQSERVPPPTPIAPTIPQPKRLEPIAPVSQPPRRGLGVVETVLVGIFLFGSGFGIAHLTKVSPADSEAVQSDRFEVPASESSPLDDQTHSGEKTGEVLPSEEMPALNERALRFLYEGRVITRTGILPTAEFMFVTSPIEGDPRLHRLFVIDCQSGSYARNAESLELDYLFGVMEMLMQGEPFTMAPLTPEDEGTEVLALFDFACT
jgi:hypothetical protein